MIYGYIRVSTDAQTVENQRFEINRYCEEKGLEVDGWIEETISGTKNFDKRLLGKLLRLFGTVKAWSQSLYDYGDSSHLYEQKLPCMDNKRQLPPRR